MNTRLDYIDKLRGFAILLVVIGHLYQEHTAAGNDYPISQMIYSFHMSLFFFISGYVCELTHKIDKIGYISFLKKKAVALLIPWIFWVLVVNLILPKTRVQSIGNLCIAFNFYPNRLYWFMPVLFLAMLLYAVQYKIIHKSDSIKKRLLYICVLGIGLSCFGFLLYEYALLIYAIYATSFLSGAILKNQPKIQKTILNNKYFGGAVSSSVYYGCFIHLKPMEELCIRC